MPELLDIINDLPPELQGDGDSNEDQTIDDDVVDGSNDGDSNDTSDDDTEDIDADDTSDDDSEDDDYITSVDNEDEDFKDKETPSATTQTDENQYILTNLTKISVRIIAADDSIKTVEVYGFGDLPRDYKGFPTKYEEGLFQQAANAQELKARELQTTYRQSKTQADTDAYVKRENRAIADDLTELRQEGVFPKFKGIPGSREFNESLGAKEFDKVVAYMNKQNDNYGKAANSGKSFRHIGFREAFIMLNGPNPRAAEKAEDKARKVVAAKLKSGRGTSTGDRTVSTKPVTNINELANEFSEFIGQGADK